MPPTRPALDIFVRPSSLNQPVHRLSSFLRLTVRWKFAPHAGASGSKFSVLKGISISADQPRLVRRTRASQMPSHALFVVVAAGRPRDQAIAHRARRVDLEEVARPPVEKRIDRPHEAIVRRERLIALHLVAQQLARLRIETGDAENDPVLVEDDPDLGSLGRRLRRCRGRAGESRSPAPPSATPPRRGRRRGRSIRPRPAGAPGPPAAGSVRPRRTHHTDAEARHTERKSR